MLIDPASNVVHATLGDPMQEPTPAIATRWHLVSLDSEGRNPHAGAITFRNKDGTFALQFRLGVFNQLRGVTEWMEWRDAKDAHS